MPTNDYNPSFLESPDPTSGLQRRTGQQFLDIKQTVHERRTLEHDYDPDATPPQSLHGTHRMGSAKAYYQTDAPVDRPTGKDKSGVFITALPLTDDDAGRLWVKDAGSFYFYKDTTDTWIKIDSIPVGFIQLWPSATPPVGDYLKCAGAILDTTTYAELFAILGYTYGGSGSNFNLPNFSGVTAVGSGQLDYPTGGVPEATVTGRMKGDGVNNSVGLYAEDELQTFEGSWAGNGVYAEGNIINEFTGIFKSFVGAGSSRALDRTSPTDPNQGAQIDLDQADVRNGVATRTTALVMDYYIKAL